MNDLMVKSVARLMRLAGFDRCATALENGDLEEARSLRPCIDPCAELARKTPYSKRNKTEHVTIAAADALANLLQARAA